MDPSEHGLPCLTGHSGAQQRGCTSASCFQAWTLPAPSCFLQLGTGRHGSAAAGLLPSNYSCFARWGSG